MQLDEDNLANTRLHTFLLITFTLYSDSYFVLVYFFYVGMHMITAS